MKRRLLLVIASAAIYWVVASTAMSQAKDGKEEPKEVANGVIIVYKLDGPSDWVALTVFKSIKSMGGIVCLVNFDNHDDMKMVKTHLRDDYDKFVKTFRDEDVLVIPVRKDGQGAHSVGNPELFGPKTTAVALKAPSKPTIVQSNK